MDPWTLIGWTIAVLLIVILAGVALLIVVAVIVATVNAIRGRKPYTKNTHSVYSVGKDTRS